MTDYKENIAKYFKGIIKRRVTNYYLNKVTKENFYTEEKLNEIKLQKWKRIARYAVKNVPFYIETAKSNNFTARDINTLDDLKLFPLISKTLLMDNQDMFLPLGANKKSYIINSSSGTTGKSLDMYEAKTDRMLERAYILDQWSRVGFNPARSKTLALRGRSSTMQNSNGNLFHCSIQEIKKENISSILKLINDKKIKFLHTYPTSIKIFLSLVDENPEFVTVLKNLEAVLLSSENVDPEIEMILKNYGIKIFYHYGHTEHLIMAAICEHSNEYHIYPSYGLCELIDDNNLPVNTSGVFGEMVGTSLNNFVMPLIRYKTGDFAEWSRGNCKCGRKWQRLKNITGKYLDYKVYDSDMDEFNFTHHYRATAHLIGRNPYLNIVKYQYVQTHPGLLTFYYIPGTGFSEEDLIDLKNLFAKFYNEKIKIVPHKVSEINNENSGKLKPLIQNIEG